MMDQSETLNRMCRSCLQKYGTVSLFTKTDNVVISDMLFACASVKVLRGEGRPEQLCAECSVKLRDAFLFRELCLRSEARLNDLKMITLDIKPDLHIDTKDTKTIIVEPADELQDDWLSLEDKDFYQDDIPLKVLKDSKGKGDVEKSPKKQKTRKKLKEIKKITIKVKKKKTINLEKLNRKLKKLSQMKSELESLNGGNCKLELTNGNSFDGIESDTKEDLQFTVNGERFVKYHAKRGTKGERGVRESSTVNIKREIFNDDTLDSAENGVKKEVDKNIEELYFGDFLEKMKMPNKKRIKTKPKTQFVCDLCGHCVRVKCDLITHLRKHTGEKPYECSTCGKRFAHDGGLRVHQKQHSGIKSFMCDICGQGLSTKDTLLAHRRLHTGELPFTCPTCGRAFRALTNLRSHRKIHTGDKRHACPVCGKLFYTRSDMRDHCRRHSGDRPFACSLCPRRFTGRSNHRLHMKIHAGQKDFHCPHCPKTFVSRDSMLRHGRTHSGERAFECSECGRKFAHRSSLVSHRAIHSKTKDYVCDICNQRFGYPSGLYVHRKKKHNIQSSRTVPLVL